MRVLIILLLLVSFSFALEPGQILNVETTAYTHTESSHSRWGAKAADGKRLSDGNVCSAAACWGTLPLGTTFKVISTGKIYKIHDYGSALVGKNKIIIDLYTSSRRAMNRWGRRDVSIEILKVGSYEQSLKILKPRQKYYKFIRQMVYRLEKRLK